MTKTKKSLVLSLAFGVLFLVGAIFGVKNLIPTSKASASEHVHCFCGETTCSDDGHDASLVWTAWDGTTSIDTIGNYYLSDNVDAYTLTDDIIISANANLCLNGKTLDLTRTVQIDEWTTGKDGSVIVNEGVTLNVCDPEGEGKIQSANDIKREGTVLVYGTFNLYSGTLDGGRYNTVFVYETGKFNAFGGNIENTALESNYSPDAAIYSLGEVVIDGATVNMNVDSGVPYDYPNRVNGRKKQTSTHSATFTLKSGLITGLISNGGTFNVIGGKIEIESAWDMIKNYYCGVINVSGGEIIGIGTEYSSAASRLIVETIDTSIGGTPDTVVNVTGGKLVAKHKKNYSSSGSRVIYAKTVYVSGGELRNEADGPIFVANKLYLSNAPVLYVKHSNCGMASGEYIPLQIIANDGKADPTYFTGEEFSLITSANGISPYETVVTGLKDEEQASKFRLIDFIFNTGLQYIDTEKSLRVTPFHTHCICGLESCTLDAHKYLNSQATRNKIYYAKTNSNYDIPTGGLYFLENDINFEFTDRQTSSKNTFCLNGYNLNGANEFKVMSGGKLYLADCKNQGVFSGFVFKAGSEFNVYGGKIGDNVYEDGCTVTLYGGLFREKLANAIVPNGYAWFDNNDQATKDEYPYLISSAATINFEANGGEGEMESQVVRAMTTNNIKSNQFIKLGYTFIGWSTSANGDVNYEDNQSLKVYQTMTLYAVWAPSSDTPYTVEHYFESLDGTFILDETKTQILQGTTETPVNASYVNVVGFNPDEQNANKVDSGVVIGDGSLTLKLYYVRTLHTVSISVNGSDYGTVDKTLLQNVKYGTPITANGYVLTIGENTVNASANTQTQNSSYYFVDFTSGSAVLGDTQIVANFIAKGRVAIPTVDTTNFIYTGSELTYTVATNDKYTVSGNKKTDVGAYTVVVSLNDKVNYEWTDGKTADLTFDFIIKAGEQNFVEEGAPEGAKPSVVVSTPNGLSPDVALVVVDKTEDPEVIAKIPEKDSVKVEKIFDISLEKNGDNIQVSEVGGIITIKILLDEELKTKDLKLYHIHNDTEVSEIVLGEAGKVNQYVIDGDYAVITIDRLSEFAFVSVVPSSFPWWIVVAGVLGTFAIVIVATTVIKLKKKKV